MEFADKPNFTVAGVTDWTAVGGHGSDATLRTSEAWQGNHHPQAPQRARFTRRRKGNECIGERFARSSAGAPGNFEANHQLGAFYLHAGRYPQSVPLLQAAYRIDPTNRGNEYDLARAYEEPVTSPNPVTTSRNRWPTRTMPGCIGCSASWTRNGRSFGCCPRR